MIRWDWSDFFATLTPSAIGMLFILGTAFGAIIYGRRVWAVSHAYWMTAAGVVFFIPLALIRALEGYGPWERLVADLALWDIFVIGTAVLPFFDWSRRAVRRRRR